MQPQRIVPGEVILDSLSVVLPAHNEADSLEETLRETLSQLEGFTRSLEVIVVNDGSTDGTADLLRHWTQNDPRIKTVEHTNRQGYGAALCTGFARAEGDWVFFTDADGQFDLREVWGLLAYRDRHPFVVGYRTARQDPPIRLLMARVWTSLVNRVFGLSLRDVNCAFKLLDRRALFSLELSARGASVNAELFVRARAAGLSWVEVPVSHRPRQKGRATGGRPGVILSALKELLALKRAIGSAG